MKAVELAAKKLQQHEDRAPRTCMLMQREHHGSMVTVLRSRRMLVTKENAGHGKRGSIPKMQDLVGEV